MSKQHYLIIGNGIAGMSAAIELRQHDRDAQITLVSRESEHFFSRTALMYEYCGQLSLRDMEPYERDHYDKMGFERIFKEVVSLDHQENTVQFSDGSYLAYDKLLIACGSVPSKAPWQREGIAGVGHFVTLQDLEWLKSMSRATEGKLRAAAVGGGLIGVEVAEVLHLAGIETHFVIREEWYWPVALNKNESTLVATHLRSHGLHVHLGTEVVDLKDDGERVTQAVLSSGTELDVDFVVVAIGVQPATDWLQGSELTLSEGRLAGVEVDEFQRSNVPNVYAAGDCATVQWFNDVRRPEQLWYTGRDQGIVAAQNMLGKEKIYQRGTFYNSAKFFDIEYTTAGLVNFPIENSHEWYQEDKVKNRSQRIVVQDGAVIGFNMLGSRWNHQFFIEWIEQGRSLDWVLDNLHLAIFDAEFSDRFAVEHREVA